MNDAPRSSAADDASTDGIIRQMSDTLANKIAAGEVVQRPASVAKELIENAVDAGASSIELIVKDAGSTLVQVIDDGCGMSRADARRCFDRHATSKIRSIDDLDRIRTLGFRGEALASIASIAHVDLKTKRVEDDVGTEVRVEGGEVKHVRPCATPNGTSIAVRNLFYNVPARRNFLKTPATELKHLTDTFRFLSLAHPEIAFRMEHKGRSLYDLPAASADRGTLAAMRQRVMDLLEMEDDGKLLDVKHELREISVRGLIIDPTAGRRKKRGDQFLFVNERYVEDRYLSHAVRNAYGDLLPEKAFPFFALFLDLDPSRVDVNVHPTKAEVKFDDESGIYGFLKSSVRKALATASHTPQFRSGNASPESGSSEDAAQGSASSATASGSISRDGGASSGDTSSGNTSSGGISSGNPSSGNPSSGNPSSGNPSSGNPSSGNPSMGNGSSVDASAGETSEGNATSTGGDGGSGMTFHGAPTSFQPRTGSSSGTSGGGNRRRGRADSERRPPDDAGALTHELYRQPEEGEASIGPVWSLHGRYLMTPTQHGLLMIDQRAAHVRVLYEEALAKLSSGEAGESQQLLFPQTVELDPAEDAMLEEWMLELRALGFDLERLSGRTVQVRGLPVHVRDEDQSTILQTVMDRLRDGQGPDVDERHRHIAQTLARQSAVPRGHTLSTAERRSLLRRLMNCDMPYVDPTGTPTTLDLSMEEIEKRFSQ